MMVKIGIDEDRQSKVTIKSGYLQNYKISQMIKQLWNDYTFN